MTIKIPVDRIRRYKKLTTNTRKQVNMLLGTNIKRITYKNLSDFIDMDSEDLYGYTVIDKKTKTIVILLHNIYKLELKEGPEVAERVLVETIFHEARHLWQIHNIFAVYHISTLDPNVKWLIENDANQFTTMNTKIIDEILKET